MRSIKNMSEGDVGAKSDGDIMSKYEGMNETELMSALMRNVAEAKSDGSFSESQLDEFVSFVSSSLDEASRERLAELVKMIKG